MEIYKDLGGSSSILAYEVRANSIWIKFNLRKCWNGQSTDDAISCRGRDRVERLYQALCESRVCFKVTGMILKLRMCVALHFKLHH